MVESALAICAYAVGHLRRRLERPLAEAFLPQAVPAFAGTKTPATLCRMDPDCPYKAAMVNPTNPRPLA